MLTPTLLKTCAGCRTSYQTANFTVVPTYCPQCLGGVEGEQMLLPTSFIREFFTGTASTDPVRIKAAEAMTVEHREYVANGKKAPKYRPVHWHDWIQDRTRPWKPPRPAPMRTRPGPDTYTLEIMKEVKA